MDDKKWIQEKRDNGQLESETNTQRKAREDAQVAQEEAQAFREKIEERSKEKENSQSSKGHEIRD